MSRAGGGAHSASPAAVRHLRTCSDDEDYAVFAGVSTSEPDTDELMDGRNTCGPGPGGRLPSTGAKFHAGAAAAAAGGIGTGPNDDWLFDLRRPPPSRGDDGADVDVRDVAPRPPPPPPPPPLHHPGCSGVASYQVATTAATTAAAAKTTASSVRTTAAAARVVVRSTAGLRTTTVVAAALDDAEIDDLLFDFKQQQQQQQQQQERRQQQQQERRQQQQRASGAADADDGHHHPSIERVSLASLAAGPRVTFSNTLPPPVPAEGPLQFSDRARFAGAAPAAAAAGPLHAPRAPAHPLQGMAAVVGPGASVAYEDEALSFSRSRRWYVAPAASEPSSAAAFRHPGM